MNIKLSIEGQTAIKELPTNEVKEGDTSYTDDQIIEQAKQILANRFKVGTLIKSPQDSKDYLQLKYSQLECETFGVLWLDNKHKIISEQILFRGTIDSAMVPVREIVKEGLQANAAAALIFHNHPSGNSEPSRADKSLTENINKAFNLVGIKLLDHLVVATGGVDSLAEMGYV